MGEITAALEKGARGELLDIPGTYGNGLHRAGDNGAGPGGAVGREGNGGTADLEIGCAKGIAKVQTDDIRILRKVNRLTQRGVDKDAR